MNSLSKNIILFLSGVAVGGFLVGVYSWRSANHWYERMYVLKLQDALITTARVSRGDNAAVLQDWEMRAPSMISSVASFGLTETTRPVLMKTKEFYNRAGRPLPTELTVALGPR